MICEWCKREIKPPRKLAREGRCDECESERVLLGFMIEKAKSKEDNIITEKERLQQIVISELLEPYNIHTSSFDRNECAANIVDKVLAEIRLMEKVL